MYNVNWIVSIHVPLDTLKDHEKINEARQFWRNDVDLSSERLIHNFIFNYSFYQFTQKLNLLACNFLDSILNISAALATF